MSLLSFEQFNAFFMNKSVNVFLFLFPYF